MTQIKANLKHKAALCFPVLIYFFLYMSAFRMLENVHLTHYYHPFSFIDRLIPFNQYFVIPYVLWFLFVPGVCIYLLMMDETVFKQVRVILITGMTFFLVFSALFPTMLYLRPAVLPGDDLCCRILAYIYETDTPTNVFPSIHVFNTCAVMWGALRSNSTLFSKRPVIIAMMTLSISIILSTMFIKQHSLVDVIGGLILFFVIRGILAAYENSRKTVALTEKI